MSENACQKALKQFVNWVNVRNPNEPEFLQAVEEFAESVIPYTLENDNYARECILERMAEPDRVIMFRVCWEADNRSTQINRGYRVQFNNAIGPYKGGIRFHPSVNLSILKFLGFEQTFKNSLTTLPLGGAKGGSDFDPKGKSDREIMRFCQAYMTELFRHIGQHRDVPAGDIGVGGREVSFLFGQYKRLNAEFSGVLTGKGMSFGGSLIRPEATGYGAVYLAEEALQHHGDSIKDKVCTVSGSGNVAQYTTEKVQELGGKVVTLSDSSGFVHDPDGVTPEKLAFVIDLKTNRRGRIAEYAEKYGCAFHAGKKPWIVPCQIAFPSATQNELDGSDAEELRDNGCRMVVEGANMPTTQAGIHVLKQAGIHYLPGKAANAGGVAVSGLEMAQNSMRISWTREETDARLRGIMKKIHATCVAYGSSSDGVDYQKGANIGGFIKVAEAMLAYGIM